MRLQDYDHGQRYVATLLDTQRITPEGGVEVRELRLELAAPDFRGTAGQSVGVIVPGPHALGHAHHFRLYSLAADCEPDASGIAHVTLCVRRCNYIDEYSGEEYRGVASNYLCDLKPGDRITINGPFGLPFEIPEDPATDLLLISMGTGIAPFRAFVAGLYRRHPDWQGKVRLFHGAMSGLELLYMNDERDDFGEYYDRATFQAFKALSPRPHWADPVAMDYAIEERAAEVQDMLSGDTCRVYVAGKSDILETLDKVFAGLAGSMDAWRERKEQLRAERRWFELVY